MKEKIILKSTNPEEYGDLEIECRVIENNKIKEYLDSLPEERKLVAYKTGMVTAREGVEGEEIETVLKTKVDGKEYILSEEKGTVKVRPVTIKAEDGEVKTVELPDMVVTNISSTSNEQYIVKAAKFFQTYWFIENEPEKQLFIPDDDPRILTKVDENVIIVTAWGAKAICLKGSYIVTYNAEENDYNTLEEGAFKSTYQIVETQNKTKKKKRK